MTSFTTVKIFIPKGPLSIVAAKAPLPGNRFFRKVGLSFGLGNSRRVIGAVDIVALSTFHPLDFVVAVRKFVAVGRAGNFGQQQLCPCRGRLRRRGLRINQRRVTGRAIAGTKGARLNRVGTGSHFATLFGVTDITLRMSRKSNPNSAFDQPNQRGIKFSIWVTWKSRRDAFVLAWMAEGTGDFLIRFVRERIIHVILMLLDIKERVVAFARRERNQRRVNRVQVLMTDGTHSNGTGINRIEFLEVTRQTGAVAWKLRNGDIFLALVTRFARNHFTSWIRCAIRFWSSLVAFVGEF